MDKSILILGKVPPPIGGVTIHVQRLLQELDETNLNYEFKELNKSIFVKSFSYFFKFKIIHLHTSSQWVQAYLSILNLLLPATYVVTFHGDLDRYKKFYQKLLNRITLKFASYPVVLNKFSFNKAIIGNKNSRLFSSFIPPLLEKEKIPKKFESGIEMLRKKYEVLFCTNAYNLSFDKNGIEIYGIYEVLKCFEELPNVALVFSDPSGVYSSKFANDNTIISENVLILKGPHSFYKVLDSCDVSIRNTTTDGDSLSVKESLYLNKITMATQVVNRPKGTYLYNRGKLQDHISIVANKIKSTKEVLNAADNVENGAMRLIELYKSIIT
ncbi:MAG: hypothetical protein ACSHWW_09085 [Nonlabens sp.]|uniref:hypothetical protein n=1 Tax=Nonlabens sp. TaxID=1888209 RepID=UPI003EF8BE2E